MVKVNNFYEKLAVLPMNKAVLFGVLFAAIYYIAAFDDGTAIELKAKKIQKELQIAIQQKSEIEKLLATEKELKEQLDQKESYYEKLETHVPATIQNAEFHKIIDDYAKSSDLELKIKKPLELVKGNYLDEVPVQVSGEGDYHQVAQFLSFISGSEKTILARNLQMKAAEGKNNKKSIVFEVTLNALKQSLEGANETK